jgi:hypothetical protein
MSITQDFSDFPKALYKFAVNQILWYDILEFDESGNKVREASDAEKNRQLLLESDSYGYWAWWSRFSTGFEALVKSVFLSNEISLIEKNSHLEKGKNGSKTLATPEAARVYDFIKGSEILASNNAWLQANFIRLDISCPYEINSGTLGKYRNKLGSLERLNKISSEEHIFVKDSITVL